MSQNTRRRITALAMTMTISLRYRHHIVVTFIHIKYVQLRPIQGKQCCTHFMYNVTISHVGGNVMGQGPCGAMPFTCCGWPRTPRSGTAGFCLCKHLFMQVICDTPRRGTTNTGLATSSWSTCKFIPKGGLPDGSAVTRGHSGGPVRIPHGFLH